MLDEQTTTTLDGLPFDDHLMPLDSLNSIAVQMPVLGSGVGMQPFRTVRDYDNFLARIRAFSSWADLAIARSREGIGKGFTLPRPVILRLLPQLESQVVASPEDSTFWGPVERMPASFSPADRERLTRAYREAITGTVIQTYRRLVDFVKGTYAAAARNTVAAEALPDGPARYAARVRRQTTTRLDPHAIHRLGLDEVQRINGEIEALRIAARFEGTRKQFMESITADPAGTVTTEQALVAAFVAMKATVQPRLPELFSRFPKADFEVRPIEKFRENAASSQYVPATPDGSRPGVFYVNAARLRSGPQRPSESLFLHEAIPGHHFQVALTSENLALPRMRRFALYNAYVEGWALYCEGFGRELGLYRDVSQQAGRLRGELLRAVRLVLDTGMHHEGWSRERALDYATERGRGPADSCSWKSTGTSPTPARRWATRWESSRSARCARGPSTGSAPRSTSAPSTTPFSSRGRCRSTCWRGRCKPGTRRRADLSREFAARSPGRSERGWPGSPVPRRPSPSPPTARGRRRAPARGR